MPFVASRFDQLPKYGPEELNLAAVVDKQVRMESAVDNVSTRVDQLSASQQSSVAAAHCSLDSLRVALNTQMEKLTIICKELSSVSTSQVPNRQNNTDRAMNVVLFGVEESRDISAWHQSVSEVLHHVAGRSVDTDDMFRVGRFTPGKVRPIIVRRY